MARDAESIGLAPVEALQQLLKQRGVPVAGPRPGAPGPVQPAEDRVARMLTAYEAHKKMILHDVIVSVGLRSSELVVLPL